MHSGGTVDSGGSMLQAIDDPNKRAVSAESSIAKLIQKRLNAEKRSVVRN